MEHFYKQIHGWFNFQDIYQEAVKRYPNGSVFVEIGNYYGRSTAFMAVEIARSEKAINFYSIDPHDGWGDVPTGDHSYEILEKNLEPAKEYVTLIRKRSTEVDMKNVDFVFIDGDHSYEEVKADIAHWLPRIKKGGMIGGHDYDMTSVRNAVNEFFNQVKVDRRDAMRHPWTVQL